MRAADDGVRCSIVDSNAIAINDLSIGEDHVPEEAMPFIFGGWHHDRFFGTRQHFPRLIQIQQHRAKTVTILFVRAVVDFQPAIAGVDGGRARADSHAVPLPRSGHRDATVVSPVLKIGRLGEPDVIATNLGTGGAMKGKVIGSNLTVEDGDIFVMSGEDDSAG